MNQYVFVKPGERLFVLTDKNPTASADVHVLEITDDGIQLFDELCTNECCNLTHDGKDLLSAYKECNEERVAAGQEPEVATTDEDL
jgi:hypothetical protein